MSSSLRLSSLSSSSLLLCFFTPSFPLFRSLSSGRVSYLCLSSLSSSLILLYLYTPSFRSDDLRCYVLVFLMFIIVVVIVIVMLRPDITVLFDRAESHQVTYLLIIIMLVNAVILVGRSQVSSMSSLSLLLCLFTPSFYRRCHRSFVGWFALI